MSNALKRKFRPSQEQGLYESTEIIDEGDGMGMAQISPSQRAGVAAVRGIAGGGSAADVVSGGLMATGNPYAIGAAAGLQVLSASKKREQRNRELQYQAKLERISRQQRALENMTGIAQSLRNL